MWHKALLPSTKRQGWFTATWSPQMFSLELTLRPVSQTIALRSLQTRLLMKIPILQATKPLRPAGPAAKPLPSLMSIPLASFYWSFWPVNIPQNTHSLSPRMCLIGSEQWGKMMAVKTTDSECLLRLLAFVVLHPQNKGQQCGKFWRWYRRSRRAWW